MWNKDYEKTMLCLSKLKRGLIAVLGDSVVDRVGRPNNGQVRGKEGIAGTQSRGEGVGAVNSGEGQVCVCMYKEGVVVVISSSMHPSQVMRMACVG